MALSHSILVVLTIIASIVSVAQAQADAAEWLAVHNAARQALGMAVPDLV